MYQMHLFIASSTSSSQQPMSLLSNYLFNCFTLSFSPGDVLLACRYEWCWIPVS